MKRYLVFAFNFDHPAGGWMDLRGAFDSFEEAQAELDHVRLSLSLGSGHIVDLEQNRIVIAI